MDEWTGNVLNVVKGPCWKRVAVVERKVKGKEEVI